MQFIIAGAAEPGGYFEQGFQDIAAKFPDQFTSKSLQ